MKTPLKTTQVWLIIVAVMACSHFIGFGYAQKSDAPSPSVVTNEIEDKDPQVWQGRILKVANRQVVLKIEGEPETFLVSRDAKIRKDRKKIKLKGLHKGAYATLHTVPKDGKEVAIVIRAFSRR